MKERRYVMVLAAIVLAATAGPAAAQDRLLQEAKDAGTGATMRVYSTASGPRIEMETTGVRLEKQVIGDKIVTSLKGPAESLVIELGPHVVSVAGTRGRAVATAGDRPQMDRARQVVALSPLAARAAAIIGKIGFAPNSAIEPLLLTTRAFLLAARNDQSGAREMSEWARKTRQRTQVVKVAVGQRTPGDCFKAYGDEILAAYDDYVDCVNHLHWWDPFGENGCAVVYEFRIIGAFTWYAGCVSLGSIIGK